MCPFCPLHCSGCVPTAVRLGSKVGTISQVTFPKLLVHSFLKLSLKLSPQIFFFLIFLE